MNTNDLQNATIDLQNPTILFSAGGHTVYWPVSYTHLEGGEDVIRDPIRLTAADEIVALSDVTENSVCLLYTSRCV